GLSGLPSLPIHVGVTDQGVRLAEAVSRLAVGEAGEVEAGGRLVRAAEPERHLARTQGRLALAEAVALAREQVARRAAIGPRPVVVVALGHERAELQERARLLAVVLRLLEHVVGAGVAARRVLEVAQRLLDLALADDADAAAALVLDLAEQPFRL